MTNLVYPAINSLSVVTRVVFSVLSQPGELSLLTNSLLLLKKGSKIKIHSNVEPSLTDIIIRLAKITDNSTHLLDNFF